MKTPEEIAREHCATYFTPITGDEAVHSSLNAVCIAIEEAQKEAWNEAIDACVENAKIKVEQERVLGMDTPVFFIDKESVLKLKK